MDILKGPKNGPRCYTLGIKVSKHRKIHNFIPDPPLRALTLDARNSTIGEDQMHWPLYFSDYQLFPQETINSCCYLQAEH